MFQNFKAVPNLMFGRGCFNQMGRVIDDHRETEKSIVIFLVDDVFKLTSLQKRMPLHKKDLLIWVNVNDEPKTNYIDELTSQIKNYTTQNGNKKNPSGIIGIGGGSTMDIAKAVSLMLTNAGPTETYQGWDLIKHPGIYHLAVPTLSGTGAEVSRTSVLTGSKKKLGINSDYTVFDQIILDPEMTEEAPRLQRFYTGMDCYIHCVESLEGIYINTFSQTYAQKAMDLCQEVFMKSIPDADDKLMMASYFGGMSIAYSQVGICHALSYGLSFITGIHHGIGNCMIFNALEEFYPARVQKFRDMLDNQQITLPKQVTKNLSANEIDKMIDTALILEPLWKNALGENWKSRITRADLRELYLKI